jgi:hypothetical protein
MGGGYRSRSLITARRLHRDENCPGHRGRNRPRHHHGDGAADATHPRRQCWDRRRARGESGRMDLEFAHHRVGRGCGLHRAYRFYVCSFIDLGACNRIFSGLFHVFLSTAIFAFGITAVAPTASLC